MSGLPPKPASAVFEVHVNGKPPLRTNILWEAQVKARQAAANGETAIIKDGVTGSVIERHEPERSA